MMILVWENEPKLKETTVNYFAGRLKNIYVWTVSQLNNTPESYGLLLYLLLKLPSMTACPKFWYLRSGDGLNKLILPFKQNQVDMYGRCDRQVSIYCFRLEKFWLCFQSICFGLLNTVGRLSEIEWLEWFSKRTGTSFQDGKARGYSRHDSISTSGVSVAVLLNKLS